MQSRLLFLHLVAEWPDFISSIWRMSLKYLLVFRSCNGKRRVVTRGAVAKHFSIAHIELRPRSIKPEPSNHSLPTKCPPCLKLKKKTSEFEGIEKTLFKGLELSYVRTFKLSNCQCVFQFCPYDLVISRGSVTCERCTGLPEEEVWTREGETFRIINSISTKSFTFHMSLAAMMWSARDKLWNMTQPSLWPWLELMSGT